MLDISYFLYAAAALLPFVLLAEFARAFYAARERREASRALRHCRESAEEIRNRVRAGAALEDKVSQPRPVKVRSARPDPDRLDALKLENLPKRPQTFYGDSEFEKVAKAIERVGKETRESLWDGKDS